MSNDARPKRPTGLSGQEEEDLRSLEKGYDPDAGALPDPDHRDDPTRKPGDDSVAQGSSSGADDAVIPAPAQPRPLGDAERRGLVPPDNVAAPPMDRPDGEAARPVDLDPDPGRRRP
jgi:hypothetical protein